MPVTESRDAGRRQDSPRPELLYTGQTRLVSLLTAGTLSLVLTLYPQAVIQGGRAPGHAALMLCMWGIAGGFVHGVGFVPRNPVLQVLLGPLAAWLLMLGGTFFLLYG
jgi:predicted membrane protein